MYRLFAAIDLPEETADMFAAMFAIHGSTRVNNLRQTQSEKLVLPVSYAKLRGEKLLAKTSLAHRR